MVPRSLELLPVVDEHASGRGRPKKARCEKEDIIVTTMMLAALITSISAFLLMRYFQIQRAGYQNKLDAASTDLRTICGIVKIRSAQKLYFASVPASVCPSGGEDKCTVSILDDGSCGDADDDICFNPATRCLSDGNFSTCPTHVVSDCAGAENPHWRESCSAGLELPGVRENLSDNALQLGRRYSHDFDGNQTVFFDTKKNYDNKVPTLDANINELLVIGLVGIVMGTILIGYLISRCRAKSKPASDRSIRNRALAAPLLHH